MPGTLYTSEAYASWTVDELEAYDAIRFSQSDPFARVEIGLDGGGTLNLASELGLISATIWFSSYESYQLTTGAGNDRIEASEGADVIDAGAGSDSVTGGYGADILLGGAGADTLLGSYGQDNLYGGTENDVLDGGDDVDRLEGGAGDDTYIMYGAEDQVIEHQAGGTDRILLRLFGGGYRMSANVENLTLSGSGSVTGNGLANQLTASTDAYGVTLIGGGGNDTLKGSDDYDRLDGGTGQDRMIGGEGDDVYVVDSALDVVIETEVYGGEDAIVATASYTLPRYVENLSLGGAASLNGTGNGLDNVINGNAGANNLLGHGGIDWIYGGGGSDTLTGGNGADSLYGGTGNDVYNIDNSGDRVQDLQEGGSDTIRSTISFDLQDAAYVEHLILQGSLSLNGYGNSAANRLTGNSGNNRLEGLGGADSLIGLSGQDTLLGEQGIDSLWGGTGADVLSGGVGSDSLSGGLGNDTFVFASRAEAGDRIGDFRNVTGDNDRFILSAWAFGAGFASGTAVTSAQFQVRATGSVSDTTANSTAVRFIWEADDERLWSDTNGRTAGGLVLLADLQDGATLGRSDLILV